MNSNRVLFVLLTVAVACGCAWAQNYRGHFAGNRDRPERFGCAERDG